ncbi:hypothetical protein GX586_13950, partial [bacterium]|nr:hypothetical protein [bacterium]
MADALPLRPLRILVLPAALIAHAAAASTGVSFVETFDQQVSGTRALTLHAGSWSSEPKYSIATNALGRYGLDTNIYLNSYNPALWSVSG